MGKWKAEDGSDEYAERVRFGAVLEKSELLVRVLDVAGYAADPSAALVCLADAMGRIVGRAEVHETMIDQAVKIGKERIGHPSFFRERPGLPAGFYFPGATVPCRLDTRKPTKREPGTPLAASPKARPSGT